MGLLTRERSDEHEAHRRGAAKAGTSLAVPKDPIGENGPAGLVGRAVHVAKIATGKIEDTTPKRPNRARAGRTGARARAESFSSDERSAIARAAAATRWGSQ